MRPDRCGEGSTLRSIGYSSHTMRAKRTRHRNAMSTDADSCCGRRLDREFLPPAHEDGGRNATIPSDSEYSIPAQDGVSAISPESQGHEWQEYLIEAWALGCFMISVGLFAVLLEASSSPLHYWIPDAHLRRVILAAAMGITAVALIYSPWGQRSGAHMNPAVTLAFLHLRKITLRHALGYTVAQAVGGILGVFLVWATFGASFSSPPVSFVATVPGEGAELAAFFAELSMSALLMLTLLASTASRRLAPYTGIFAGILIFAFISLEAPLSGMSINPARSFASAVPAHQWASFWIYLVAPILGMQLAAVVFARLRAAPHASCAKLYHSSTQRCIHCGFQPASEDSP
jgi:aquaporin Z